MKICGSLNIELTCQIVVHITKSVLCHNLFLRKIILTVKMVAENSTMLSSLLNRIISYFSIISKKNKPKRMTKKMRPSFEDSLQFVNFDRMDSDSHKTIVLSESCYSSNQASPTQTPRRLAGDFVILDHK